ncbi:c-type cytochrome biogenesis protein CcsB [Caldimonas brevitalea]|uniref:Cytochrome C assembly protein n=1 Tax=Caldimonas brevitalea TaxID=413882 RepID=A0A0G3BGW8_9BURK|nr:c-type cytochrome biogenesis protein CcsB [Caldimonas brevitalea]AKJ28582.1 cytochrome C assembly protein [Caldimonas brevitalea]
MNHSTTLPHPSPDLQRRSRRDRWRRRTPYDWGYAALLVLGQAYAYTRFGASMDVYDQAVLALAGVVLLALGWHWSPLRHLVLGVTLASLTAVALYERTPGLHGADLGQAEQAFWLKYALSSQSAILWMALLFGLSTLFYWIGLFGAPAAAANGRAAQRIGAGMAWAGVFMALVGTLVRWYESHQMGPGVGHIPVSNLYEVFVLFSWLTTLFLLYFEALYARHAAADGQAGANIRSLGAFVMLVVSAGIGFLLWYTVTRGAQQIQPLVPALQSWWMKLHVPANFVGYGTFALAAMVALAALLKSAPRAHLLWGLVLGPSAVLLALLGLSALGVVPAASAAAVASTVRMLGGVVIFFAVVVGCRNLIGARLPDAEVLDDLIYKAIAIGFAFFTIATVLGALWAAEAWGGYWSWDPKETWALIVWLNYAAWLHMRLMKGLRGEFAAWWALVGLLVTSFAFLGVNMFLSGLHSYGEL